MPVETQLPIAKHSVARWKRVAWLAIAACSAFCIWSFLIWLRASDHRAALSVIEQVGGKYNSAVSYSRLYKWLAPRVGSRALDDLWFLKKKEVAVSLANTRTSDSELETLVGLVNLKYLDLTGTRITDSGLEYLSGFPQLETLCLSNTDITDEGLDSLTGLRKLNAIVLLNNQLSDKAVEQLKSALPTTTIITDLRLEDK